MHAYVPSFRTCIPHMLCNIPASSTETVCQQKSPVTLKQLKCTCWRHVVWTDQTGPDAPALPRLSYLRNKVGSVFYRLGPRRLCDSVVVPLVIL